MTVLEEQGEWCSACQLHHQPRERKVLCLVCRRNGTASFHAICPSCEAQR